MPCVLHVVPYLARAAGGPPVVVERLAEHAAELGWRSHVISTPMLSPDGEAALRAAAEDRYELTLFPSQMAPFGKLGRQAMRAAVLRADVVHLHTNWSPLNLAASWACKATGRPYVLSPHGMLDPWSLSEKPIKKRLYLAAIERGLIAHAAAVAFTAADERDLAMRAVGAMPHPVVVALGADGAPAPLGDLRARFADTHPDLAARPIILFLGRLHPKKRPEAAIDAMPAVLRRVAEAMLVFVGAGDAAFEEALRARTASAGLDAHVRFLGARHGVEKWAALAAARVFVLPSRQENFGIAVAEALHAAVPVLLTRHVNICRDIVEAGAGLELREDALVEDLAGHAADLLTSPDRQSRMAERAADLAAAAYTWPQCAAAMCSLYDELRERPLSKGLGFGTG